MRKSALLIVMAALLAAGLSGQEKRVALVIGNGGYKYNTTLKNPANDANDMAQMLRNAGFEILLATDASLETMNKLARDFGNRLRGGQTGLFYYSGHGVQVNGKNYLLPIDQDIQEADEVAFKALDAEAVLSKMESAGSKLNFIFLDACRNNPFPGSSRSAERGLAPLRVNLPESVIVYATEPGKTASDGDGRNSPFTLALLHQMIIPDQDILVTLKRVKAEVSTLTKGNQSPRVDQNLSQDFSFFHSPLPTSVPRQDSVAPLVQTASRETIPGNNQSNSTRATPSVTLPPVPASNLSIVIPVLRILNAPPPSPRPQNVLDHKNYAFGGEIPDWVQNGTGLNETRFKDLHTFIFQDKASSLEAAKQLANQRNINKDVAQAFAVNYRQSQTSSAEDLKSAFEQVFATLEQIPLEGAKIVATYWVYEDTGKVDTYRYFTLVSIPKDSASQALGALIANVASGFPDPAHVQARLTSMLGPAQGR